MKTSRPRIFLATALLAGAAGCASAPPPGQGTGQTGGPGVDGSTTFCGDPNAAIDPTAVIDDMESPAPPTVLNPNGGGILWAGGDPASKATGATIVPDGPVTAEAIPGGRCGSHYAAHVTGYGFNVYAVMTATMGWGPEPSGIVGLLPYDAHIREGLTFWARIGDTSTDQVRLNVTDKYSNDAGGICDKTVPNGDTACYDHFGAALTQLGTDWKQYRIPFGGLSQLHFGIPRPELDTSSIYSVDFSFPTGRIFDFWVDDISFY